MAVNLNKTDLVSGSGASRYPLISDGQNLLVIKNTNAWNNREFIVTPAEEYFSQAVTYGEHSAWGSVMYENDSDAREMQNRLAAIRDRKGVNSWYEGHKPMYAYWARSFPPYRILTDRNITTTTVASTMELGSCWKLLRFNLFRLPTGLLSSFSAYWRVWNPSCLEVWDTRPEGLQPIFYAQNYLHAGAGVMRYRFDSTVKPPKFHQATENNVGYGEADIAAYANEGHGDNYTNFSHHPYDIYNAHLVFNASGSNNSHGFHGIEQTYLYYKTNNNQLDSSAYYADIPITGNGLAMLKSAIKGGNVWAYCGFPTLDAQSAMYRNNNYLAGQRPYSCLFVYCSRLELRLVASWSKFNT